MAAGPAAEEASHAPNNQPEPIKLPSPNNTSWTRLILPSLLFCPINTPLCCFNIHQK